MAKLAAKGKALFRRCLAFVQDEQVPIQIRILLILQISILAAIAIGTISMVLLQQPFLAMLPNFLLLVLMGAGLWCSRKHYFQLASALMIVGCADIAMPIMYFMAGGSNSGMPIWLVFGVVMVCMVSSGKTRVIMVLLTLMEDITIMLVGWYYPESITPMAGEVTGFFDMVQSFAVVCIGLCVIYTLHIMTYERQREQLEFQRKETERLMQTDELTGVFNRRAYYQDISAYQQGQVEGDLVLVALDVNGLKKVNDSLGHAQGDLLLRSAADVIVQAFCKYGRVYRTGGDEFTALLHCSQEEASRLKNRLHSCIKLNDNPHVAIAMGAVRWGQDTTLTFLQMERLADSLMYADKRCFYQGKETNEL